VQGRVACRRSKERTAEAELEDLASAVEKAPMASGHLQKPGVFDGLGQLGEDSLRSRLHQVPQLSFQ
jgi:hypothetical protein